MTRRVLFVSRTASRSGAPMQLLHFIEWLRRQPLEFDGELLTLRAGALSPQFEKLLPSMPYAKRIALAHEIALAKHGLKQWKDNAPSQLRHLIRIGEVLRPLQKALLCSARLSALRGRYDLIYSNTAANGAIFPELNRLGCPIITHVHELEYVLSRLGTSVTNVWKYSDFFIAASQAVHDNLVERHHIPPQKIAIVHECIPTPEYSSLEIERMRSHVLQSLSIPPESFLVVGGGTLEWRKGSDIWVQVARVVKQQRLQTPIHFLWVGGNLKSWYFRELLFDVQRLGLQDCVHFIGEQTAPHEYFAAANLFFLPSREDPFPLVCLEAAGLGKPILCFADAGGMPEFVENDCGWIVPYLDIKAAAEAVVKACENAEVTRNYGCNAATKICERHGIEVGAPQIWDILQQVATRGKS